MKINRNTTLALLGGALLGFAAAFCLGAAEKEKEPVRKGWSHVQVIAYPNGGTGFFDADSGTMYVYDADLRSCYMTRQLTSLGDRTVRP